MKKVRIGIIGAGKVGQMHGLAVSRSARGTLSATFDTAYERAKAFTDKFGGTPFDNLDAMLDQVDAVIVCTPHPVHAEPAVTAGRKGKHLLIEKPLASTISDCDRILAAAAGTGVKVSTMSQRRWIPGAMRIKRAIEAGKLGTPAVGVVHMQSWRTAEYYLSDPWRGQWNSEGGGVLVNQSPHQLDLLLWYMGPIKRLVGVWRNVNHPTVPIDDTALAIVEFKSGALGQIYVSNSHNPAIKTRVEVLGSNGATVGIKTDGGAMFIAGQSAALEPQVNDIWNVPGESELLDSWVAEDSAAFSAAGDNAMQQYHDMQVADFIEAIADGRDPLVSGEDGRRVVELFSGIYRSQFQGGWVDFPLPPDLTGTMDGRLAPNGWPLTEVPSHQ